MAKFDFSGWATKANVLCSDGRTIMKDAFKHNDGQTVPMVWNHKHDDVNSVLGHALLENRDEGVYAYCTFNDTETAQTAKLLVQHGDIASLSIYANQLKQNLANVVHGNIREVSLVLSGANPGASIDSIIMHGEESDEEAIIYNGEPLELFHADNETKEDAKVEDEEKKTSDEETVKEVLKTFNKKQMKVTEFLIGQALKDAGVTDDDDEDESEGGKEMKHNVFDKTEEQSGAMLSHSAQEEIIKLAKTSNIGTFQTALNMYAEESKLQHDGISGFVQEGEGNITTLFPEYHDVRSGAPELITDDQDWVNVVMRKVHKSPFSRIRTSHVDIREVEELRAKGYKKGTRKTPVGNYNVVRRTTDPQTVYVKSALHRDDTIDITDFDIVKYQYDIDRMNLNQELATAIMFGDGRDSGAEGKIEEDKIRPIWTDDDLYTLHVTTDPEALKKELQGTDTGTYFGENFIKAESMVNTCLYAREDFKGTGTPDMFIDPHYLNVMLLARDRNGHRMYASKAELAQAMNVANIYTCEKMKNKTRTDKQGKTKKLNALIVNLADYSLGATKGGEVTHFTQFDIDFNQQKSLLETRCSGANTRIYSAIAIEEEVSE